MMIHADFIQKILLDRGIVTTEVFNQEEQLYHFGLTLEVIFQLIYLLAIKKS